MKRGGKGIKSSYVFWTILQEQQKTVLWLFIQCNLYYLMFSEPGPNFTKVFRGFGGFFQRKSGLKSKKCAIRAFLRFNLPT